MVKAAVPLRVQLDRRAAYNRAGTELVGHLAEPIFAGSRLLLPAGTRISGHVTGVSGVTKRTRLRAISQGDFTPLRVPTISFDQLTLPDGRTVAISTTATVGDAALVRMEPPSRHRGLWSRLTQTAHDAFARQKQQVVSLVRTQGKWKRLRNGLLARLPYHPQAFDPGTRFIADVLQPIEVPVDAAPLRQSPLALTDLGSQALQARLVSDLNSASAKPGDGVEAVVTRPVVREGQVVVPEGARLLGSVTQARGARRLGRHGELRFTFDRLELPSAQAMKVRGILTAAAVDSHSSIGIDEEGAARTHEPAARALAPLGLMLLAQGSAEPDHDGLSGSYSGSPTNTIAGGGFGLVGRVAALASGSRPLAFGLGYYAAAGSIYSRFVARGKDVVFPRDTMIEVQLGSR